MELKTPVEAAVSGTTSTDITDTTPREIIAAAGAGQKVIITDAIITNSHATVGTVVQILNGTTVRARIYAAPIGGGAAHPFITPLRGSANTAWNAKCETTGSSVQVTLSGIKYPR